MDNINKGFTPFFGKFGQIKGWSSGANSVGFAMSQSIHDADNNLGMTNKYDGYMVIRKYLTCDASIMAMFDDPSVWWYVSDLSCTDCYTTHNMGYYKDDVSNKKKTFTLGYSFNGDLGADTNKASQVDKYILFITGLQALGASEQQIFDCIAGSKPANIYSNAATGMNDGCDYSDCVGEKILIF